MQLFIKLDNVLVDLHLVGRNCAINPKGVNEVLPPVGVITFP
jgi:hypothetical protein